MIIIFAFGKSIPTSITVVETKISIFLFKKLFKTESFSFLSNSPCNKPTFSLNFLERSSNLFIAAEKSTFFDSSINGHTQNIWFPKLICFFKKIKISSIFSSGLLNVIIF